MLLAHNWWSLALRGVVGILIGILTFAWPGITLDVLVLMFGVYAFLDGVFNLAGAWRYSRAHERWGVLLLEGIIGIGAGVVTFAWPAITAFTLVILIAVWAIITGIFEIAAAFRLRRHIAGEWLLGLLGVVSIAFGVMIIAAPLAGALVLAIWFGAYALVFGVLLTALAFRLRHWNNLSAAGHPGSTTSSVVI
jgi:uncharacterized membrane protein HdeD (DUF308 family)